MKIGRRQNEAGMSLVAVMGIVALITVGAMSASQMYLGKLKDEQQISLQDAAEIARRNVMSAISHDESWKATIANDPSMACLRADTSVSGVTCSPPAGGAPFSAYLADGSTRIVNATAANAGFDRSGNPCDTFDDADATKADACPLRYELKWSCESSPCAGTYYPTPGGPPGAPNVRITAELRFKPKSRGQGHQLQAQLYNFAFTRGKTEFDLSASCKSIGGYFDQGTKRCSIQSTNTGCDERSQYMVGWNADGTPKCRNKAILGVECPPRTAAVGLDGQGKLICWKF